MSARKKSTLSALIELAGILIMYRLQTRENEAPVKITFWHGVMVGSQATARTAGRLGMYAETRYRESARP